MEHKVRAPRDPDLRGIRTWVEISRAAIKNNVAQFRRRIGKSVRLMSVVKSNAYGHGLYAFSSIAEPLVDCFAVDSLIEGVRLRESGVKKPILVLGATLPERLDAAVASRVTVTLSNMRVLRAALSRKSVPEFHIKLDTGMHRQGFQPDDMAALMAFLEKKRAVVAKRLKGIYTHFACAKGAAKDPYTEKQIAEFERMTALFWRHGFSDLVRHAAATAGTLMYPSAHYDMVRVGIGLYGMFPSAGIASACADVALKPVLSWRSVVSEVKRVSAGSYIGYDCTERVARRTTLAIIPIGYWHGFDRGFSGIGEVLIRGRRAKVLGRVSMDMIVVDVSRIPWIAPGDVATLIGADRKGLITPDELASQLATIQYEVVTRINPLIERIAI